MAPSNDHAVSHAFQRAIRSIVKSSGKVSTHASSPCARVKLLANASKAHVANFAATAMSARIATRPATRNNAGKNDGNPLASSQTSTCAGEKMQSVETHRQIAKLNSGRFDLRSRT